MRFMKILGVGAVLFSFGGFAVAADVDFGFQYRAGLTHDDDKLNEDDAVATTNIALEFARLTAKAEPAKNIMFMAWYDMHSSTLQQFYVKHKVMDMLSFSAGRMKTPQGGWHAKDFGYESITGGNDYKKASPFMTYTDALALHASLAGTLTLYFTDDVVASSKEDDTGADVMQSGYKNTEAKQPATIIQWTGSFSGWEPLVQIGSYDLNKSMFFSVGVKGGVAGLDLALDYTSDSRTYFMRDGAGNLTDEDAKDTYSAMNLKLGYALSGFTPWLEYNSFDVKQGTNDDIGREDSKVNSDRAHYDDNGMEISVGANCTAISESYVPYLAISQKSAKFADDKEPTKEETLSTMQVKFGVLGKF